MEENEDMNEENEEVKESKIKKVKRHLVRNKKTYIVGGACFVVGVAVGFVLKRGESDIVYEIGHIKGIAYKPTTNNTTQTISMYGNRIGRPGTAVIDTTTNKRYESITLAANALDVPPSKVSDHLAGRTNHVGGHVLVRADDEA